jgi:CubicO group peptidase (beta-lactamase class C family)
MADSLDGLVLAQMREHHLPGLSLAVISDGKISKAQGYGFTDRTVKSPVTTATLFQAASVSKCAAALGALRLVDQGKLSLDEDLNNKLLSWKFPPNDFVKNQAVTLRRLLSHNAGVTVHGFRGYLPGQPIPTLTQILNGTPPANNPAIRVDAVPGPNPRYSGGGYTVLQQLLIDVTGRPFPELMQSLVLQPLGMTSSSFDQPLSPDLEQFAAIGHSSDGRRRAVERAIRSCPSRYRHSEITRRGSRFHSFPLHHSRDANSPNFDERLGTLYQRRRRIAKILSLRPQRRV